MSEYQYYEFQAIDRPLTAQEMGELRARSTRANITSTSFTNDYAWGSFKGNEDAWMEKYFDAFLYLANWGTHILQFRLPSELLGLETASAYCAGSSVSAREKAGKVILRFESEDDHGEDWVEGSGRLAGLIAARDGLLRGDLRALYLGWLLLAQTGELEDEDLEPPVPPGLGKLNAALEGMADFLCIDRDLLQAASAASRPLGDMRLDREIVRKWVQGLAAREKDDLIAGLVLEPDPTLIRELHLRFLKEQPKGIVPGAVGGRSVGLLLRLAKEGAAERKGRKAEARARQQAVKEQEAAIAREAHLDGLVGQEFRLWAEIEALAATKQPKHYEQAVQLLGDLRDMGFRSKAGDFPLRLEQFRLAHARKPVLLKRIRLAGL
jgi:hypothetical protein